MDQSRDLELEYQKALSGPFAEFLKGPEDLFPPQTSNSTHSALDGQVAAFVEGGNYLVTSPNTMTIYAPLFGPNKIYFRKDYRFGAEDPLLYPQPFISSRCHWAAIPRRPNSKDNRIYKWWDQPPSWAFVQDTDSAIQGMGRWTSTYVQDFAKDCNVLYERAVNYRTKLHAQGKDSNPLVSALHRQLSQTLRHIKTVSLPHHLSCQLWSFFQRWYLELVGALDWVELYQPAMEGHKSGLRSVSNQASLAMGAFTYSVADCEFLFRAGLPFWYVRSSKHPATKRIGEICEPTTPESLGICLDDLTSHARQVIYEGPSTDIRKATSVEKFGTTIVDAGNNPFAISESVVTPSSQPTSSEPSPSSAGPSRVKNKRSRQEPCEFGIVHPRLPVLSNLLDKKTKPKPVGQPQTERDKFVEIRGPFSPDIPEVWVEALASIDRSRRPKKSDVVNGGYAFPDPGMILFTSQEKRLRLLRAWLEFRPVLLFRHTMAPGPASSAWPPRQWQLLLAMTDDHPSKERSYVAQERSVVQNLLGQCLDNYGLTHVKVDSGHFTWRNERHSIDDLSDSKYVKEIIWELYELNFRFEFQALDAKYHRESADEGGNSFTTEVQECFPDTRSVGRRSEVDLANADRGLAARKVTDRAPYFLKMCKLFKDWPGGSRAEKILSGRGELEQFSEFELEELERWAARFYCQTFYENFGRPPILPHALYIS
jgi:hypothetical protein